MTAAFPFRGAVLFAAALAAFPVLSAPLTGVSAISAGGSHTCAITGGGAVQCWGANFFGALGDGTTTSSPVPLVVPGLAASAVGAGGGHTCAAVAGGAVKCWGYNAFGQLGDGSNENRPSPVDVVGLAGIVGLSVGPGSNCVVTAAGGVKCWGDNSLNQLGGWPSGSSNTPVDSAGLTSGVASVANENRLSCVVTTGGGVKCWGYSIPLQPGASDVPGLASGVTAVSVGSLHRCALMASGGVKCWGFNSQGQLGDGTTMDRFDTPADVLGLTSGVAAIDVGYAHSCAVTAAGGLKCWGDNSSGQLGDGTTVNRSSPVDVVGLTSGVASVSAGLFHTCAVMQNGEARCWGSNVDGQLARGPAGGFTATPGPVGTFAAQSIAFDPLPPRNINSLPFTVSATASSGLPVTFRALTPEVCTVSGSTVTMVAIGICSVGANQGGDATFGIAPEAVEHFLVSGSPSGAPARLANISARCAVDPQARPLIVGLVLGAGPNIGTTKSVLFRARGPSLAAFGVPNPLADPLLQLYFDGQRLFADNNDWQVPGFSFAAGLTIAPGVIADIGMAPADNLESAILIRPGGGSYTAVIDGTGAPGVAIGEIFEIDNPGMRIVNLSARGWVGTGDDVLIGGFVIEGDSPVSIIVRARGPSLVPFGIPDALANPTLQLVSSSDQTVLSINNDWEQAANASQILASGFAPSHPQESAILITLTPGAYTAIVSGVGGTSGVGIVEVFTP